MPAQRGAGAGTGPSNANGRGIGVARPGEDATPSSEPGRLQAAQVRSMFDGVAGVYDLLNTAMTAGLHHRWRARAAELARIGPGARVLDVATGTGDLALELARRVAPDGEVLGSDFSEGMLARARSKADACMGAAVRPRFEWGDALALPYEDASFDAATVGFGARNFADLGQGLREMARVVRPGGRVVVLEITTPTKLPLSVFYALWFDRVVPLLGRAAQAVSGVLAPLRQAHAAGSPQAPGTVTMADAYTYLPSSVKRFPGPLALAGELERAGLGEITYRLLAGGIVAIHAGTVAAGTAR